MPLLLESVQFELLYKQHYTRLVGFAYQYVEDSDISEDIVQDVFTNIWNQADRIEIRTNIKSYLFGAVRNASLNHLKHEKIVAAHAKENVSFEAGEHKDFLEMEELEKKIEAALELLPEKRREIFEMSKLEGKKYHEIAAELDISVKTVETQMSRALKVLREVLGSYLTYLIVGIMLWLLNACQGKI